MVAEKSGHEVIGFFGFGKAGIVPESVGQTLKDDQLSVDAGAEIGSVEDGSATQEEIAAAGDEEGGRKSVEIGVEGRVNWIPRVGGKRKVFGMSARLGRVEVTGETVEGKESHGIAGLAEVAHTGENSGGTGERQIELLEFYGDFGGENGSRGGAIDGDVVGLVRFKEIFVNGDGIVEAGGKRMFGSQAVENGDDFGTGKIGDGDGLGERAGIGIEATAVEIDEHTIAFFGCDGERCDDADGDPGDGI